MTSHNLIVFKSLSERREMRVFRKNAILGLGVGSNPGPLASKVCALKMRHSTSMSSTKLVVQKNKDISGWSLHLNYQCDFLHDHISQMITLSECTRDSGSHLMASLIIVLCDKIDKLANPSFYNNFCVNRHWLIPLWFFML